MGVAKVAEAVEKEAASGPEGSKAGGSGQASGQVLEDAGERLVREIFDLAAVPARNARHLVRASPRAGGGGPLAVDEGALAALLEERLANIADEAERNEVELLRGEAGGEEAEQLGAAASPSVDDLAEVHEKGGPGPPAGIRKSWSMDLPRDEGVAEERLPLGGAGEAAEGEEVATSTSGSSWARGRIGPAVSRMDVPSSVGRLLWGGEMLPHRSSSLQAREESEPALLNAMIKESTHPLGYAGHVYAGVEVLESRSNFCSCRGETSVYLGRWMFEVTVRTSGIQQLGWVTKDCPFTNEEGAGDAVGSFSFDGHRVKKWNVSCQPYGQRWVAGDVIGCLIDLDKGECEFMRNGVSLGVAYRDIKCGDPGTSYHPAASLSLGEKCEVNLGGRPFVYPAEGYRPISIPPPMLARAQAAYLCGCFYRLCHTLSSEESQASHSEIAKSVEADERSAAADASGRDVAIVREVTDQVFPGRFEDLNALRLSSLIVERLAPLLSRANASGGVEQGWSGSYIVGETLIPTLHKCLKLGKMQFSKHGPTRNSSRKSVLKIWRSSGVTKMSKLLMATMAPDDSFDVLMVALGYLAHSCGTVGPWVGPARTIASVQPEGSGGESLRYSCQASLAVAEGLLNNRELLEMLLTGSVAGPPAEGHGQLGSSRMAPSTLFGELWEGFMSRKQPNNVDMGVVFPTVWWHGTTDALCSDEKMRSSRLALEDALIELEEGQQRLTAILMSDVGKVRGSWPLSAGRSATPRLLFLRWLRHFLNKNKGATRNMVPCGLSDNSVLLSVHFVLLDMLQPFMAPTREGKGEGGVDVMPPDSTPQGDASPGDPPSSASIPFVPNLFTNPGVSYFDLSRFGGNLGHLLKNMVPGPERNEPIELGPVPASALALIEASKSSSGEKRFVNMLDRVPMEVMGCADEEEGDGGLGGLLQSDSAEVPCFIALLDACVILYHLGLVSNFKQASINVQNRIHSISQLADAERRIRRAEQRRHADHPWRAENEEFLRHLREIRSVNRDEVHEQVRICAYFNAEYYTPRWKQESMFQVCTVLLKVLQGINALSSDALFAYIPECYAETMIDSFHALRRADPPFQLVHFSGEKDHVDPDDGSVDAVPSVGFRQMVDFLVVHFDDARIINPDVRDFLLQSMSVLLQYKQYTIVFEQSEVAKANLVRSLLENFDNRFWISISNIFNGLWSGLGFGQGGGRRDRGEGRGRLGGSKADAQDSAHESSSHLFQRSFVAIATSPEAKDVELVNRFLNRVFNHLNYTVTEFFVSFKELHEIISRDRTSGLVGAEAQHLQRKSSIMFGEAVSLLRILEVMCRELPEKFLDVTSSAQNDINLVRLLELTLYVMNHTTRGVDSHLFNDMLQMDINTLEKVTRPAILAPIAGIIGGLWAAFMSNKNAGAGATGSSTFINPVDAFISFGWDTCVVENFKFLGYFDWLNVFPADPSLQLLSKLVAVTSDMEAKRKAWLEESKRSLEGGPAPGSQADEDVHELGGSFAKIAVEGGGKSKPGEEEDDNLCPICCAQVMNARFDPCGHTSCLRCITRNLLNSDRCFYCNAQVVAVIEGLEPEGASRPADLA